MNGVESKTVCSTNISVFLLLSVPKETEVRCEQASLNKYLRLTAVIIKLVKEPKFLKGNTSEDFRILVKKVEDLAFLYINTLDLVLKISIIPLLLV